MNHNRRKKKLKKLTKKKKKKVRSQRKHYLSFLYHLKLNHLGLFQHAAFSTPNSFLLKIPSLASCKFQYLLK